MQSLVEICCGAGVPEIGSQLHQIANATSGARPTMTDTAEADHLGNLLNGTQQAASVIGGDVFTRVNAGTPAAPSSPTHSPPPAPLPCRGGRGAMRVMCLTLVNATVIIDHLNPPAVRGYTRTIHFASQLSPGNSR